MGIEDLKATMDAARAERERVATREFETQYQAELKAQGYPAHMRREMLVNLISERILDARRAERTYLKALDDVTE